RRRTMTPVLDIHNLSVIYQTDRGPLPALDDIALMVNQGEIVGLVGQTGCGKSTLARAILGTLPRHQTRVAEGHVILNGTDRRQAGRAPRLARGCLVTFVPQDTYASLNPLFRIGTQIADLMRFTAPIDYGSRRGREAAALAMLEAVQLPHGRELLLQYPHQ